MASPDTAASAHVGSRKPRDDEFDVYGLTHVGHVREVNQDHFLLCSLHKQMVIHHTSLPNVDQLPLEGPRLAYLGMVADGVGGGTGGEEASRTAIEVVAQYVAHSMQCYYQEDPDNERAFLEALQHTAMQCHASVLRRAEEDPDRRSMATTLTLWIGVWPRAYLLQVGDSRCYLSRDGELTQITRDQTMAQELYDEGILTRTEAHSSHLANILSSSIGGPQTVPMVTRVDQSWDHVGLLCSDGLTKHVSDDQIAERLRTMTSAKQACQTLLRDALDGGGTDNITIVVGRTVRKEH